MKDQGNICRGVQPPWLRKLSQKYLKPQNTDKLLLQLFRLRISFIIPHQPSSKTHVSTNFSCRISSFKTISYSWSFTPRMFIIRNKPIVNSTSPTCLVPESLSKIILFSNSLALFFI